jgi:hypothetical protein
VFPDLDSMESALSEIFASGVDFVVPIPRRGERLVEMLRKAVPRGTEIVSLDEAIRAPRRFAGARVCLLDDGADSGETLDQKRGKLLGVFDAAGVKPQRLQTAALVVFEGARFRPDVEPSHGRVDRPEYMYRTARIHHELMSTGLPLDTHHLLVQLTVPGDRASEFIGELGTLYDGRMGQLRDSGLYDGVRFYTIHYEDFVPWVDEGLQYSRSLYLEGVSKIRLFVKGNRIVVLPLVFPALELGEDDAALTGKGADATLHSRSDSYNDVVMAASASLLLEFCRGVGELRRLVGFELVDPHPVAAHTPAVERIQHSLSDYFEGKDQSGQGGQRVSLQRPEIRFDCSTEPGEWLSPPLSSSGQLVADITAVVNRMGKGKVFGNVGLPFTVLKSLRPDRINPRQVSECLDLLLDQGLLKPDDAVQGVPAWIDTRQSTVVVRSYRAATEAVADAIRFARRLATGRVE